MCLTYSPHFLPTHASTTTLCYLGVHLDGELKRRENTRASPKKTLQAFLLLRSVNVSTGLLDAFYQSILASVLFYAVLSWGGGSSRSTEDKNRINKMIKKAGSVIGLIPETLLRPLLRREPDLN